MKPQIIESLETAAKGITGILGSSLAVILPWQEQMEWGVRVAGGLLGVLVAILSVVSIWKSLTKK